MEGVILMIGLGFVDVNEDDVVDDDEEEDFELKLDV